jgi:hypothetical protein
MVDLARLEIMDRERAVKFNFMEFISSFIAICSLSYWNYVTTC